MVELREHQKTALTKMRNGSILAGGVGTGKSITSIAYFIERECGGYATDRGGTLLKNPKDLYIITTAMKRNARDWEGELRWFALSPDPEHSIDGIKVVIDSWQNIKKYKEVTNAFFIFDEQRLVGNGVWVSTFISISKNNSWILLSATPGDTWSDYIPVFVANGFYRNRTEFNNNHVIFNNYGGFPKIEKYYGTKKLHYLRDQILVDMPYERHTVRHREYVLADYNKDDFITVSKKRWDIIKNEPIENASQLYVLLRRVSNDGPDRIDVLKSIIKKHPRLIIFYNFDYELERLRPLAVDISIEVAEHNGHRHDSVPTGEKWLYLVQYASGAEAWNCVTTNAIVFYSLNHSYRTTEQAEGRIDRLNTPYTDLYYYYLYTESYIDRSILRALRHKKDFNIAAFQRKFIFDTSKD